MPSNSDLRRQKNVKKIKVTYKYNNPKDIVIKGT